eukprot:SAG31_NODE_3573_length_4113_cov_4.139013_7_plen_248_part_00
MSTGAAAAAGPRLAGPGGVPPRLAGSATTVEEDAEAMVSGPSWNLLVGMLSQEEQLRLFDFIHERDATDWEKVSPCMNPSPKTLQLFQHGAQAAPLLSFGPDDEVAVVEMVQKAIAALGWTRPQAIKSLTVAAIRYCASGSDPCIGSCFPPHVDHCNDGSWVFLFSLGCTATFHIKSLGMAQRHTFEMKSGDALVFDPSSEAAVLHGVDGVARGEEKVDARRTELGGEFEVLRHSRFGVQCRVSLAE